MHVNQKSDYDDDDDIIICFLRGLWGAGTVMSIVYGADGFLTLAGSREVYVKILTNWWLVIKKGRSWYKKDS